MFYQDICAAHTVTQFVCAALQVVTWQYLNTEDHKELIRDLLYRYKLSLVQHIHLYTNSTDCTGFSNELINCALERSAEIFDLTFIMDNLPMFSKRHGQKNSQGIF